MGSSVAKVISPIASILGGGEKATPTMEPTKRAPVPDADDEAARRERRRKQSQIQARSGRTSTILSDAAYSGEVLG